MIYHGMTPNPALSAGMVLTELELKRLSSGKLRKGCRHQGNKFVCEYRTKGNDIYLGTFDTREACNAAWDREDVRRKNIKPRKPNGKGWTERKNNDGTTIYKSTVSTRNKEGGKVYYLGAFKTKEGARARYVEAINQINSCTFDQWYKNLPKGELMD